MPFIQFLFMLSFSKMFSKEKKIFYGGEYKAKLNSAARINTHDKSTLASPLIQTPSLRLNPAVMSKSLVNMGETVSSHCFILFSERVQRLQELMSQNSHEGHDCNS